MPDARFVDAAREAVCLASSVCRSVQARLDEVRAITKDDRSPVTVADFASQAVVAKVLSERLGEIVLVAEENSAFLRDPAHAAHLDAVVSAVREAWPDATPDLVLSAIDVGAADPAEHASFWTLDPIDGTKGFLRNQQYAVALGYVERDAATLGVMGCPNLPLDFSASVDVPDPRGSLYFAVKHEGVWETTCDAATADAHRLSHLDRDPRDSIVPTASVEAAHTSHSDTDRVLEYLAAKGVPSEDPLRMDSQAKYAVVARGQADVYLRLPTKPGYVERIWDHAAGSAIANEAGCFVTDIHGNDLDFSRGRGLERNRGIVCAPARVHALVLEAIKHLNLA